MVGLSTVFWGQTTPVNGIDIDIHITSSTTRDALSQIQQELHAQGIGFRYDLIHWDAGELQSIRLALRLGDGSMQTANFESLEPETDIRIVIHGTGEDRVFCVGTTCPE